jgi:hypothetical protein
MWPYRRLMLQRSEPRSLTPACNLQVWADVDAERVREINSAWLGGKAGYNGGAELQLMTWPFYEGDEWASRKFYAYNGEGKMLAFMFFIPCFRDGQVRHRIPIRRQCAV